MFIRYILTLLVFVVALFANTLVYAKDIIKYDLSESEVKKYENLNHKENRLIAYKDDKNALLLKLNQLAHINASRKKHHQPMVELDILASRVANKIAREAATNNFMGHYNLKGESPYYRYALAGGTAHVTENASALSSTEFLPSKPEHIASYMQQAHNAFMAERAPNDGHKLNCIHPHHNYIGIGFYLHKNQFRYYEEFLDRYLKFDDFNATVKVNSKVLLPVQPQKGKHLHMALAYYEKFPAQMNADAINRQMSYNDYSDELAHKILPWDLPVINDQGFIPLAFTFQKKGLYYIQIYLDDEPFITGPASTKNKVQASGVVIEVK
ncbi:Cysteine-rich secretory protein family protein [Saccharicrinis carchari]|uniref:Cysteine-rich secretory protein family protein n=1 Tax=Saccharicrinis carchari TaxID=1168039 RepID=A0A521ER55_SACCC|nr:CAP domain-containing protein [Saccharicrinis carchari]SMO86408.1 Cysteine-rich secretory protein family protein [Saccharicrinis carchari]